MSAGDTWPLVVGLVTALIGGHVAVWLTIKALRSEFDVGLLQLGVPASLGLIERLFFSIATAFNLSGVAIAMVAWIAAKMAANWSSVESMERMKGVVNWEAGMFAASPDEEEAIMETLFPRLLKLRFSALIAGLVSMLFALLGALIATRGHLGAVF